MIPMQTKNKHSYNLKSQHSKCTSRTCHMKDTSLRQFLSREQPNIMQVTQCSKACFIYHPIDNG